MFDSLVDWVRLLLMSLSKPLNEDEIDELDDFLSSDAAPVECMDVAMLHGFLTALIAAPSVALPSEWLPVVWGDEGGPEFESLDEANRILDLMMRMMNSISETLQHAPDNFMPIIHEQQTAEGELELSPKVWCRGFIIGTQFRKEDWEPLIEDDDNRILILPIIAFANERAMREILTGPNKGKTSREKLMAQIPLAVAGLYDYWRLRRQKLAGGITLDRAPAGHSPKVGRNEPCYCGSGKKFKKCHGARVN